jgi:hypothetical protein
MMSRPAEITETSLSPVWKIRLLVSIPLYGKSGAPIGVPRLTMSRPAISCIGFAATYQVPAGCGVAPLPLKTSPLLKPTISPTAA